MSKEFHIYTQRTNEYEQAFVFYVDRDMENMRINLEELYTVTIIGTHELKTKLRLGMIIDDICENIEGNVQENSEHEIIEIFKDLISDDIKHDFEYEKLELEQLVQRQLLANDLAIIHNPILTIDEVVDELLKKKKGNM